MQGMVKRQAVLGEGERRAGKEGGSDGDPLPLQVSVRRRAALRGGGRSCRGKGVEVC